MYPTRTTISRMRKARGINDPSEQCWPTHDVLHTILIISDKHCKLTCCPTCHKPPWSVSPSHLQFPNCSPCKPSSAWHDTCTRKKRSYTLVLTIYFQKLPIVKGSFILLCISIQPSHLTRWINTGNLLQDQTDFRSRPLYTNIVHKYMTNK